jgi:polysaccharide deacetylase family protein (PEP-CTERM system associated)
VTARPHVLTVDLEDWYQGLEIDMDHWDQFPPRLENGLRVLLDLLDHSAARATFFALGRQAEQTPDLIREVARRGHEVACHGYSHRFIYHQTEAQFREDVRRARGVLQDITGTPVLGFRAPFFSITSKSLWALDVLVEEGFKYDSSLFPVLNYRYGLPSAARVPGLVTAPSGATIFEVPLSTLRLPHPKFPVGFNFPMSGGGYFRLFPYRVTWALTKVLERQGTGVVFYVHPWEFDPRHPRVKMPRWLASFTHYHSLATMRFRTRRLLVDFPFVPINEAYADRIGAR